MIGVTEVQALSSPQGAVPEIMDPGKKMPFVIALHISLEGVCPINRKQMLLNILLLFSPLSIHKCFIINGPRKKSFYPCAFETARDGSV